MNEPSSSPSDLAALSRRHVRLGLAALLVFLLLGLVLEALHGFKARFYLDVNQEARRLMLRLAHAHGALLALLHVVFGLLASSPLLEGQRAAQRASACLSAALVLLPGGFLLGGLFARGGDPGPGALLAAVGGALLVAGVAFALSGVRR